MSAEIRYLTLADLLALHEMVMIRTETPPMKLRDEGLLEAAVMRPRMVAYYEQADLIRQATVLTVGISQAQAFLDGNKRTAFAACDVFLRLNGFAFQGDPLELAKQIEGIANRDDSLEDATKRLEDWLREHIGAIRDP